MAVKKLNFNKMTRFAYSFLSSFKYSFNYVHQYDYDNVGKQFKAMKLQIDYDMGKFLNDSKVIASGRSTGKTSYLEHSFVQDALTKPDKSAGYIVYQEKHFKGLKDGLINTFQREEFPFLKMFYNTFRREDRSIYFHSGFKIECRVLGQDKTGERQLVSLHVDKVVLDESQLIPAKALKELTPTQKKHGQFIYAGVPNDDRTSALWYAVSNPNMLYYRYASYESIDWDEARERRELDIHGSKSSPSYQNLVIGNWGDPSTTAFRVSSIMSSFETIPEFSSTYISADDPKAESKLNLPARNFNEYQTYGIGLDMGYTTQHPTAIVVFGQKTIDSIIHDYCVYRGKIYGGTPNITRLLNIILAYFSPLTVGFDNQNFGNGIYRTLTDSTWFPDTSDFNKRVMHGFISNNPVVTGEYETHDGMQQIKTNWKNLGTDETNRRLNEGLLHFSDKDKNQWNSRKSEQLTIDSISYVLQSEISRPMKHRIGGYIFENSVDEDTVDAIRFYYMAVYDAEKSKNVSKVKKKMMRMPMFMSKAKRFGGKRDFYD